MKFRTVPEEDIKKRKKEEVSYLFITRLVSLFKYEFTIFISLQSVYFCKTVYKS